MDEHEARRRAEEVQPDEQDEDGDADRDPRDDERSEEEGVEDAPQADPPARDRERSEHARGNGDGRGGGGDEQGVRHSFAEGDVAEHELVPAQRETLRREAIEIASIEGVHEHEHQRGQDERKDNDESGPEDELDETRRLGRPRPGHAGRSHCAQRTRHEVKEGKGDERQGEKDDRLDRRERPVHIDDVEPDRSREHLHRTAAKELGRHERADREGERDLCTGDHAGEAHRQDDSDERPQAIRSEVRGGFAQCVVELQEHGEDREDHEGQQDVHERDRHAHVVVDQLERGLDQTHGAKPLIDDAVLAQDQDPSVHPYDEAHQQGREDDEIAGDDKAATAHFGERVGGGVADEQGGEGDAEGEPQGVADDAPVEGVAEELLPGEEAHLLG